MTRRTMSLLLLLLLLLPPPPPPLLPITIIIIIIIIIMTRTMLVARVLSIRFAPRLTTHPCALAEAAPRQASRPGVSEGPFHARPFWSGGTTHLRKRGGAPRNPDPRDHFLGWIVKTRAASVQMGT
jgi:hypothetical protein